jgi:hypothetical protein
MNTQELITEARRLRAEKPNEWLEKKREIMKQLRRIEDPYGYLAHQGSELSGRKAIRPSVFCGDDKCDTAEE